jgi:hypothetical protein
VSAIQCASVCVSGEPARRTLALAASSVTLAPSDGAGDEEVAARFAQRDLAPSRLVRRSSTAFCASWRARSFLKHVSSLWPSPVQKPHLTPGLFSRGGPAALVRAAVGVALGLIDLKRG